MYDRIHAFQEAATSSEFPNLLRADFHDILLSAFGEVPLNLTPLCFEVDSMNESETYRGLNPLGPTTKVVPQNSEYPERKLSDKDTVTIYNFKYGDIISVTEEMIMFNKFAEFKRLASEQGTMIAQGLETNLASVIENTSNTTTCTGGTLLLNRANLETAITNYRKQTTTDPDGNTVKLGLVADTLLVPPDLEMTARRLLNSQLIPGSADNDINVLKSSLDIVVGDFLTSTSIWYVLKRKWVNGLTLQKVIGPPPDLSVQDINATQSDNRFRYDRISYKARLLVGMGVIDTKWAMRSVA